MSEYQYIAFRAIDHPVGEENLDFMREQSSRAEITPWSFDNQYNFGDFHGDRMEMLRRGYDIHLHYADFGIRRLLIRLPIGLPDRKATQPYFLDESVDFIKDKRGSGGVLDIAAYHEPGALEDLWDVDEFLDDLIPLRGEILDGDLRPFYIAFLGASLDDQHDPEEIPEPPVPAGMDSLTGAQQRLADFLGIGDALLAATARKGPPLAARDDMEARQTAWLAEQSEAKKNRWLGELITDPKTNVRTRMLADFRKQTDQPPWPTAPSDRTISQLMETASEIHEALRAQAAAAAAHDRAERLAAMATDPQRYLREVDDLVTDRSTFSYRKASKLLADLREALNQTSQSDLPEKHAQKLRKEYPKRTHLVGALRREGFLPK